MTIDPETGLPALPEGFAWEVSRGGDRLYVSLKEGEKRKQSFWEKLLGKEPEIYWSEYIDNNRYWEFVPMDSLNGAGILSTAAKIYEQIHAISVKNDEMDSFVGLYPPKTIL